uniref:Hflx-type G domain-containing protein n=1 Tax=Rhabditophanes sp. KR3021 TaxID=114890 RepID=A0AC35UAZ0_9BILA
MMLRKLTNSVGFSILLRSCSTIPQSIEYESVLNENDPAFTSKPTSHSFLVIHPKIRWGAKAESPKSETSDYQLEEAVSLVKTIPGFSVVESAIVGTDYNTKKKQIWGQGRLEALIELKASTRVSAVMLNIDILTPLQQTELFNIFQVPVYDRYNIVLLIFKHFAKTNLAHLQIQLAEIPYIRHRLKYLDINKGESDILQVKDAVNSLTKTGPDRLEVLRLREQSLKKKIRQSIISAREEIDVVKHRQEKLHANKALTVAVIGYTNVGKTSFIKKVTGASSLHPEDRLFATLDTSLHHAVLPSKNNIYLADTIGFISHLPTQLFGSFSATLMHAMSADLLVHLFDISHPNAADQRKNVLKTLQEMEFSEKLMKNMIQVF